MRSRRGSKARSPAPGPARSCTAAAPQDAFAKFELLERRADFAEGRAEALGISSLEDEIDQLKADEKRSTPSWKP